MLCVTSAAACSAQTNEAAKTELQAKQAEEVCATYVKIISPTEADTQQFLRELSDISTSDDLVAFVMLLERMEGVDPAVIETMGDFFTEAASTKELHGDGLPTSCQKFLGQLVDRGQTLGFIS